MWVKMCRSAAEGVYVCGLSGGAGGCGVYVGVVCVGVVCL